MHIDDILISSVTQEEHNQHIRLVLHPLENKLFVKAEKYVSFLIRYLPRLHRAAGATLTGSG